MRDLVLRLAFGLFLIVAAWRVLRVNPRYGLIAVLVVGAYATITGQRYVQALAVRRDLAELTPDRISRVELDGRRLGRPEDVAAVVRALQEAEWVFRNHRLALEAPLVFTLSDGSVRRYDVARALDVSGARIHDVRQSAYSFSPTMPDVLSRAGTPLP